MSIFKPHAKPLVKTTRFEFTAPVKDPFYQAPKKETHTKSGHKLGR